MIVRQTDHLWFVLITLLIAGCYPWVDNQTHGDRVPGCVWYLDRDADGFGDEGAKPIYQCSNPGNGRVDTGGDCDDSDPDEYPGQVWYGDADGDGFGDASSQASECSRPADHVLDATDCAPDDATVFPGAPERCDGLNNACGGDVPAEEQDLDADGYVACTFDGWVGDNSVIGDRDCNDTDASTFPGAQELCDEVDNDCDGAVPTDEVDEDGDTYRVCDGDCDDDEAADHPSAAETCDGDDNDCNGYIDDGAIDEATWYLDQDGDGFGTYVGTLLACAGPAGEPPQGYAATPDDCDDYNPAVNPDVSRFQDADGDGYGDITTEIQSCTLPSGYVDNGDDCDDGDVAFHPYALEDDCADPNDYNCDGSAGAVDLDLDGFDACLDCDDGDAAVNRVAGNCPVSILLTQVDARFAGEGASGFAISSAGDFDGDGLPDLAIGNQLVDSPYGGSGVAYVLTGIQQGALALADAPVRISPEMPWTFLGKDVAPCGDQNGDGFDDIVMHAGVDPLTGFAPERVLLIPGGAAVGDVGLSAAATLQFVAEPEDQGSDLSVDCADVNDDGALDLIVGAPYVEQQGQFSDAGAGYVVFGPLIADVGLANADIQIDATAADLSLGGFARSPGDLNGDGRADATFGRGANMWVFSSLAAGLPVTEGDAEAWITGQFAEELFGVGPGRIDANDDGYDDLIAVTWDSDPSGAGLHVFFGPVAGVTTTASADFHLLLPNSSSVIAAAPIGDFNADGYGDLAMGHYMQPGPVGSGGAWLVMGPHSGTRTIDEADLTVIPDGPDAYLGGGVAGVGDVDGDGYDDLAIASAAHEVGAAEVVLLFGGPL